MDPADKTGLMVDIMKMELDKFVKIKEKFVDEVSLEDYNYLIQVN